MGRIVRGNLPLEVTSFVGRRRESTELKRMLASARLVTLSGVGGVGKTRLAFHLAEQVSRAFKDGVWVAELGSLRDPTLLVETVAEALGFRAESGEYPVCELCDRLAEKQILLILDNCEHLIDACAELAGSLLQSSQELRLIATSRQPLGLPAEHVFRVPPLSAPKELDDADPKDIQHYEAVKLFAERAAAAVPGFAVTSFNAHDVAQLCRKLDGLPLAIELAAVRLRVFSPSQVLERLHSRFSLLRLESPAVEPRQQTLQALVDWSFGLCSVSEQTMWSRVSVFDGGFDIEAVEDICASSQNSSSKVDETVVELVEKSIIIRMEHHGRSRFYMLDTMREYGRARLRESGDEEAICRRHLDYYQRLSSKIEQQLFSSEEVAALTALQIESANIRAALKFSLKQPGCATVGLELASSLWLAWRAVGRLDEGRRWLDRLLEANPEPSMERARGLWAMAWLASQLGDVDVASELLTESAELGAHFDDQSVLAHVAQFRGHIAMSRGEVPRAAQLLESALTAHRDSGDRIGTSITLVRLALAVAALGDFERAHALADEYGALARRRESGWLTEFGDWVLSVTCWLEGDVAKSEEIAKSSLGDHWSREDKLTTAFAVEVLAWTAAATGRVERAAFLLGGLEEVWSRTGGPLPGYGFLVVHHEECLATARRSAGAKAFNRAFELGGRSSFDELAGFALESEFPVASPTPSVSAPTPELTPRERQVADLVSQGMTNKDIARTLVISQRTAEGHVERILVKLGFTSRSQIAAWFAADDPDR